VNLTHKNLPFICLCYQSPCALLLTGSICDRADKILEEDKILQMKTLHCK